MRLLLSFLCLSFSTVLFSQQLVLDTIKIPEVAISSEEKLFETPSAQLLDSMSLINPNQLNLGEVLATKSNLFVKSYGMGSMATISMRGSGSSHSNIYWNGIQLNAATNGVVDLSLYPQLFLDEVQVDYGNTSLRSGSGGLGGAVQLNNSVDFTNKNQVQLSQDLGSFNYRNTTAKYQVGNKKWQSTSRVFYRTADNNFKYEDLGEEGFPTKEVENASLLQRSLMQSVHFRPKENQQLEAHIWYYDSDRNLPAIITLNDTREKQIDQSLRGVVGYKHFGENIQLSLRSSIINDKIEYSNSRLSQVSKSNSTSFRNVLEGERKVKNTTLYARVNVDVEQANQAQFSNQIQRERLSAYFDVSHNFGEKLLFSAAAREEIILNEAAYLLPRLALNYQAHKNISFFSSISKNLKYPSLNDLYWQSGGNTELKPEENQSIEAGINFNKKLFQGLFEINGNNSIYYSTIDNYIQWQPTSLGYWQAVNLRKVEVKGLESRFELRQLKGKLIKNLSANYTYTQSINKTKLSEADGAVDQQLIYLPEHQGNISLRLDYKNYFINYQWQFVGARYLTTDNSDWLPSYNLSNISAGKRFDYKKHHFQLQASVLNLFDLEYQAIQWRPMPNRNYQLRLTYSIR